MLSRLGHNLLMAFETFLSLLLMFEIITVGRLFPRKLQTVFISQWVTSWPLKTFCFLFVVMLYSWQPCLSSLHTKCYLAWGVAPNHSIILCWVIRLCFLSYLPRTLSSVILLFLPYHIWTYVPYVITISHYILVQW